MNKPIIRKFNSQFLCKAEGDRFAGRGKTAKEAFYNYEIKRMLLPEAS